MKINLFKYVLGLTLFSFLLNSCEKEEMVITESETSNKQNILTFKTYDNFIKVLDEVSNMNNDERIAWENSQKYKSFGTVCDEFYETIIPENFNNTKEIESFVASNIDKIQLYKNPNGDIYCVTQEFKNSERYLMNEDKMYIIGKSVFKKFNDKLVCTDISNFETLRAAKSADVFNTAPNYILVNQNIKAPIQKAMNYVGHYYDVYDDNVYSGNTYRIHVYLDVYDYVKIVDFSTETHRQSYFKVMNFSLSLGIWWGKSLTTTYSSVTETYDDYSMLFANPSPTSAINQSIRSQQDNSVFIKVSDGWVDFNPYFTDIQVSASNTKGCSVTFNI